MKLLYEYAMSLNGVPYLWGGKNPLTGLDCSGCVNVILSSIGLDIPGIESAEQLFRYWVNRAKTCDPQLGALIFFGNGQKIHHVAFGLDSFRMIEAAHGDSVCTTRSASALKGAYVKMSPVGRLLDRFLCLMPDYAAVGATIPTLTPLKLVPPPVKSE